MANGQFFDLALDRGFDRVASLVYTDLLDRELATFTDGGISGESHNFWVDYQSEDQKFSMIQFAQKGSGPKSTIQRPESEN